MDRCGGTFSPSAWGRPEPAQRLPPRPLPPRPTPPSTALPAPELTRPFGSAEMPPLEDAIHEGVVHGHHHEGDASHDYPVTNVPGMGREAELIEEKDCYKAGGRAHPNQLKAQRPRPGVLHAGSVAHIPSPSRREPSATYAQPSDS